MVQGKVEISGVNTAKLPLLKQQEKEALFVCIKEEDIETREELIVNALLYKVFEYLQHKKVVSQHSSVQIRDIFRYNINIKITKEVNPCV